MNETYTLKQILFALRKEYLDIEKQLSKLRKFVEITGKIDDVKFKLSTTQKIHLFLERKQTLLDQIKKILGIYNYGAFFHNVTTDINPTYYIGRKEVCAISNPEELKKNIETILESDFAKNIVINNGTAISCNENKSTSLLITPMSMQLMNYDEDYQNTSIFLYSSSDDSFTFESKKEIITADEVYKQFTLNFNNNYFNDYYRQFLDDYEEKELDIDDNFNSNKVKLEIIEEPKKLILKPKNII